MLIKNAVDFVTNSNRFQNRLTELNLNKNACRRVDVRLLADIEQEMHYFEFYFDFGNAGPSVNDIVARLKILPDGSFSYLYFQ